MRNRLQSKFIILIGLVAIFVGVALGAILSRQQTRSLAAVTWSLEQRWLDEEEGRQVEQLLRGEVRSPAQVYQITTPALTTLFPQASFYCYSGIESCKRLAALQANQVYQLPWDFNRLLADAGVQVTADNNLTIARAFVGLAHGALLMGKSLAFYVQLPIDEPDPQLPQYHYQWEIHVLADTLNTRTAWKVGIQQERIHFVQRTLVDRRPESALPREFRGLDNFSSGELLSAAVPRRDTEYYLCCSSQGQLLMSYSSYTLCCDSHGQLVDDPYWPWGPSPSGILPVEFTAEWQTLWGSDPNVDADLLDTARQVYPDQVDETWARPWSVERISPVLVFMISGQDRDGLFLGSSKQVTYFVQASPFSWTAVPSASYVGIIASQGDKVYRLPEDFNLLLADVGPPLTPSNQVSVAQAFIWTTHRELVTTLGSVFLTAPKPIDETDADHPVYHYQLEMDSWARERGVWVRWKFGFEDGHLAVAHYTVLGRFVGSWQSHLHPNVQDPFFTSTSKYYVCCDEKGALR